jgi:hypothetical protein
LRLLEAAERLLSVAEPALAGFRAGEWPRLLPEVGQLDAQLAAARRLLQHELERREPMHHGAGHRGAPRPAATAAGGGGGGTRKAGKKCRK